MSKLYPDAAFADKRLRRKRGTADDQDWYTNQWDPGMFQGTVASVAAGTLTVQITPEDAGRYPTPDPIAVTITTETAPQAAEAVYTEAVSHLTATAGDFDRHLSRYIKRMEYTAASAVVRFVPQPGAPRFSVTMTPTGGAMTFTLSPDDSFPITGWSSKSHSEAVGQVGDVAMSVCAVTSAHEVLAIGTCTYDVQVLRVYERYHPTSGAELRPQVADLGTLTGLVLGEEFRVPVGGGRIALRITNIANRPATTDALVPEWRDAVT